MHRVVLVTGAASGIGARLAAELLRRGDCVCAVDIRTEPLEALRAETREADRLMIAALDVRDPAQWAQRIEAMVQRWGRLDVLMNVAGVLRVGYAHEVPADDVHFHFDVNAKGAIFGTQAAIAQILRQGGGHIINVASLAGIAPVPGIGLYSASKFAVRGYTLATAVEMRDKGIRLTAICPDAVQTPMLDIQKHRAEAAITFSGPRALTVDEVVAAILGPALEKAPLEILLPRSRGVLAKLSSAFPALSMAVIGSLRQRGLERQKRFGPPPANG